MECVLRKWRKEDAADLAKALSNPHVQDNLRDGIPFPYTVKDGEEFIEAMLCADPQQTYAFAITVEDVAVGSIGVFRCSNIHSRTGELGYYISEDYWNKGIGTSAVRQMAAYIFENTDIMRIFAEPFAYNQASCRILEKAGFQFEGLLRKNAVKNGQVLDMKMYATVKTQNVT